MAEFQQKVISTYVEMISCQHDITNCEFYPVANTEKDPFFDNFKYAMSRVHGYIKCMVSYGLKWLGLRFIYPLIWWLDRNYKGIYKMTKKAERDCWGTLIMSKGFCN